LVWGDTLTSRELSVLRDLPSLLSLEEIAEAHVVSVNTVKTHLKAVYRKLGVNDRRSAVDRARELGLL
jgi:LuxR family maltose regulon positive regulatory protein